MFDGVILSIENKLQAVVVGCKNSIDWCSMGPEDIRWRKGRAPGSKQQILVFVITKAAEKINQEGNFYFHYARLVSLKHFY